MKKLIVLIISTIGVLPIFSHPAALFYGRWVLNGIAIEITSDSIFIDEVGIEGDSYSYNYDEKSSTFIIQEPFEGDKTEMKCSIKQTNPNVLFIEFKYKIDGEIESYEYRRASQHI